MPRKKPTEEPPRAHLLAVVSATLLDDVMAQIEALRREEGGQPQPDMIEIPQPQPEPKGTDHEQ